MSRDDQNVLLVAFGCEPGRGSEAGIGWHHAAAIARRRPVWILCHPRHREPLEAGIAEWNRRGEGRPMRAEYVDVAGPMRRLGDAGYFAFNVYYYAWVRAAARRAIALHRQVDFAVSQHASLVRWWMPSPAAALAPLGVPFVWGPLGAGETMPGPYRRGIGLRNHATEWTRAIARDLFRLDPNLKRCARAAAVGVVEAAETERRLRELGVGRVEWATTQPCDLGRMADIVPADKPPGTFRVVTGGAAIYWKTLHLAIRAFAGAFKGEAGVEYVHVCGGNQLPRLRRLADDLGVAGQVNIVGEIPHAETLRWVKSADVYAVPAVRDTGAHLLEALSCGIPCVVSRQMSPGLTVDDDSGIRIPLDGGPEAYVAEMSAAFRTLRDDPATYARLADGARRRAEFLSVDRFTDRIDGLQTLAIGSTRAARMTRTPTRPSPRPKATGMNPKCAT